MSVPILIKIIILGISLFALIMGADLFSDFAEKLAIKFKVPYFIIGITVIAFGTSLPELFSAIMSVHQNVPELTIGDILGSSITNTTLVLGLATICMKTKIVKVSYDLLHVDLPYLVGSAIIVIMILLDQNVSLFEGFVLISGLMLYVSYSINVRKDIKNKDVKEIVTEEHPNIKINFPTIFKGFMGLLALIFGAKFFVSSITDLSYLFNINIEIVALTIVPLSSNLPELMVTIRNAIKGNSELVVGNILGSNIFNLFGILGISRMFGPIFISTQMSSFVLPVLFLSTILYFFITQEKQITKWEGGLMILLYILYIQMSFNLLS